MWFLPEEFFVCLKVSAWYKQGVDSLGWRLINQDARCVLIFLLFFFPSISFTNTHHQSHIIGCMTADDCDTFKWIDLHLCYIIAHHFVFAVKLMKSSHIVVVNHVTEKCHTQMRERVSSSSLKSNEKGVLSSPLHVQREKLSLKWCCCGFSWIIIDDQFNYYY